MESIILQINRILHLIRAFLFRCKLKNKDATIISNNCIAGVMYHDLKLQFRSPTINLFFPKAEEFVRYAQNLKYYNSLELVEVSGDYSYPVGRIDDIEIHFMHYSSFAEAERCWKARRKRINYNNLMVLMTDQGGASEVIEQFGQIPYPKVYLTNKHLQYDWSVYIPGFDEQKSLGNTIEYSQLGKRYYEYFDYVNFLNKMKK